MARTRVLKLTGAAADAAIVREAAAALRGGMLVVFPTETVYGLGCSAAEARSVRRIYELKGRGRGKPLAFYVDSAAAVLRYLDRIPPAAAALMDRFWPGPLTLLLRGGGGLLGFRCPDDPSALALIAEAGVPVVGTSANRSGSPAAVTGEEAAMALDGGADIVLDGGRTRHGRESTVVDASGDEPSIVREGVIEAAAIGAARRKDGDR
ncbi:MAG: L-threonylcarbamoyladenylate synthase [bacterium]|nr:L-threonylcarbamoyladenylate synthase [bacterium]